VDHSGIEDTVRVSGSKVGVKGTSKGFFVTVTYLNNSYLAPQLDTRQQGIGEKDGIFWKSERKVVLYPF